MRKITVASIFVITMVAVVLQAGTAGAQYSFGGCLSCYGNSCYVGYVYSVSGYDYCGVLQNQSLGIGTSAPQAKLHVAGDLKVNNTIKAHEICDENGANCKEISLGWGGSYSLDTPDGTQTDVVYVNNSADVGVGTINPQSKFAVNGTITAKEVKVTQAGWSDFVFGKEYRLLSLNELESYISTNKHLPDIPSAQEVEEEGLEVAAMLSKQMQKIEELTLYLIELKKENEELKKRITVLEAEK